MTTPLRAGVVGLGMMGRHHARILRSQLDGVELLAAADPAGDMHGVTGSVPVVATVEELLEFDLDLCVVAVATEDHEAVGSALAEARVHTLIEKPVAADVSEARRLVKAFDEAGVVAAVGHVERYNPALRSLRSRLEHGELGEIYQIATRRQGPFPARVKDVGVIKDLGTHDFDLAAWVSGLRFSRISAMTAHKAGRSHEDMVSAVGLLGRDLISNHLVNWLTPFKERLTIVYGERGAFVADTAHMDLTFYENGQVANEWDAIARFRGVSEGNVVRFAISKPEPLMTELTNFRDAVRGDEDADVVTLRDGVHALAVAEAALVSAREGRVVPVD